MKKHRFTTHAFENGEVKFAAGEHYDPTEETARYVALGHAEEVDVKEEPKAEAPTKGKKAKEEPKAE